MNISLNSISDDQSVPLSSYLLNSGSTLIGRASNCSLKLKCSSLSRWHCIVDVAPNAIFITDLHSCNGTYVNDRRVIRQPLHNDDILRLGSLSFRIDINSSADSPASDEDYPLSVLSTNFSQPTVQPSSPAASDRPAALTSDAPPSRQPPQHSAYHPDLAKQLARYEKALTDCTAQIKLLTEKVADLQTRFNAIIPSNQALAPQYSPKKAFERQDALMYIARAAVCEKVRQQAVPATSAPKP